MHEIECWARFTLTLAISNSTISTNSLRNVTRGCFQVQSKKRKKKSKEMTVAYD